MRFPTCDKCDCIDGCGKNPVPCPNLTHKVTTQAEPACSNHPNAPHGFMRNESHSAHRYVCECEGWEPSVITPPWKVGNEYLPYDPHAAHVDHDYRDGWNACYKAAIAQPKGQAMTDNKIEIKQALDKLMAHVEQFHLIYSGTQPEFERLIANLMVKTAAQPKDKP